MSDDFLTNDQVERLTGKKRKSAQRAFLKGRNIPNQLNGRGELIVLWSSVREFMGIKQPAQDDDEPKFNWGALHEFGKGRRRRNGK